MTAADAVPAEPPPWRAGFTDPPPSAIAGGAVVAAFGLTPLLAYFANLGFAVMVALAGVLSLPLLFRRRRMSFGFAALVALALWAAISMQWSPAAPAHPDFSKHRAGSELTALKLVLELALYGAFATVSLRLSKVGGSRAIKVLAVGLAVMAVVFAVDAMAGAPLYQAVRKTAAKSSDLGRELRDLSRCAYVFSVLFWPAVLAFDGWKAKAAAGVAAVAVLAGSYVLNADAPYATLAVSTAVFFAVRQFGRPAMVVLLAGVVLYFMAAPLLIVLVDQTQLLHPAANDIRVQSWAIRLDIWRFAAARIHEKPWFGWGLDAARTFAPNIPLHTHDGAMQLWLELGGVGAALACLFWVWIVSRIDRLEETDRPAAAAAAAAASAYLTLGALSFGIWQEWWLAVGTLAAIACIALARARAAPPPEPEDLDALYGAAGETKLDDAAPAP